MLIKYATSADATVIYDIMQAAFSEYTNPPSSALEETLSEIKVALESGEHSLISYDQGIPLGMVRFTISANGLYFYRLSVKPAYQRKGIAKQLLKELESYASKGDVTQLICKVRMTAPKNITLYQSIGYEIYEQVTVHKPNGVEIPVVHMRKEMQAVML